MARQPILDVHGRVHGYELLFRSGPEAAFRGDGEHATRTMIDNTVIFGLGKLTGGLPAFVNCTENTLTGDLVRILPASMTVLEILENVTPSPDVIAACRELKAAGYRIALDDFTWKPGVDALVELADYIKIDFFLSDREERRRLLARLRRVTVALVAEKIETQEQYQQARDEGFTLIQGYHFCRPVMMEGRQVPSNRLSQVEVLKLLQDDTVDMHKLALQVRRDASLTYRLLRLINSPMLAVRQEVRSVQTALIVLGEDNFRRLAALAIATELNAGQPSELLRMALLRARFCELASGPCDQNHTEQYLLGLLSLLPAMLRTHPEEVVVWLPVREEIRQALLGEDVPERTLLSWLEGQEQGDWKTCDTVEQRHGLKADDLQRIYEDAVVWAEAVLRAA